MTLKGLEHPFCEFCECVRGWVHAGVLPAISFSDSEPMLPLGWTLNLVRDKCIFPALKGCIYHVHLSLIWWSWPLIGAWSREPMERKKKAEWICWGCYRFWDLCQYVFKAITITLTNELILMWAGFQWCPQRNWAIKDLEMKHPFVCIKVALSRFCGLCPT